MNAERGIVFEHGTGTLNEFVRLEDLTPAQLAIVDEVLAQFSSRGVVEVQRALRSRGILLGGGETMLLRVRASKAGVTSARLVPALVLEAQWPRVGFRPSWCLLRGWRQSPQRIPAGAGGRIAQWFSDAATAARWQMQALLYRLLECVSVRAQDSLSALRRDFSGTMLRASRAANSALHYSPAQVILHSPATSSCAEAKAASAAGNPEGGRAVPAPAGGAK